MHFILHFIIARVNKVVNLYCFVFRCKCGNCKLDLLTNWQECNCCSKLDSCRESLSSDIVQQELGDAENIVCITQHPGFRPVCLERWSLRMAAWAYKTTGNQRYEQLANEER